MIPCGLPPGCSSPSITPTWLCSAGTAPHGSPWAASPPALLPHCRLLPMGCSIGPNCSYWSVRGRGFSRPQPLMHCGLFHGCTARSALPSAYRLQGDFPSPGLHGAFALCLELLLPFSCSDLGACRNASLIYSFSCCCAVLVPFLKSALTEAKPVSPMGSALANSRYFLDLYVGKGAASMLFSQMPLLQHAIPSYKNLAAEAQFRHNSMSVYRIK